MVLFPGVKRKLFNNRNNDPDPEFLEVIDLTSSSPAPARKRSREPQYISSQSEVQLPSNPFLENAADPFRDESGFDEEFFDGADVLEELHSQDFSNLSQESQVDFDDETGFDQDFDGADVLDELYSNYELYGVLHTKIVGVRYYSGEACPGERVVLRRELDNKYDRNAVQVTNVMGQQIGHIPKLVAGKLAPYMDSVSIVVEGTLAGAKTMFDCPVDLQLFGPGDMQEQTRLMGRMRTDGLPIGIARERLKDRQREEKKRMQEAAKEARAQRMGQGGRKDLGASNSLKESTTGRSTVTNASIGELIDLSTDFDPRDASRVVEEFGVNEEELSKMPMADAPDGLKADLYPHQRQGLAWMLDKESPKLPARGSSDIVQLWKHERNAYKNIATNYSTTSPPQLASGGILADDMGLGKTVQIISLLLADSEPRTPLSSKATLIISPLGVMSNWRDQIAEHVDEDKALRVLIYHGPGKKEAKKLKDYDVVITTYGALASEFSRIDELDKKNKQNPLMRRTATQGLFSFRWRRVVLDEGHTIRTPHTKSSRAACHLQADSRWTLTGTPIVNSLKDLYSQVRFLGISGGLESFAVFNSVLIRPMKANNPSANVVLQALMGTLCLRRKKNMAFVNLNLPPMTSRLVQIKFWPHEQKKYEMVMGEARGVFEAFKARSETRGRGGPTYSHVLEVLLRTRQICNHWALCKKRVTDLMALLEENKVVQLTPENVKALQMALQLNIEAQETCPICLDTLSNPVITACAHAFDLNCIQQVIERQHKCPMCRAPIENEASLTHPATDLGEITEGTEEDVDPDASSSKIEALLKILTAQGQAAGTKTIVFSQWTSFLDLIEPHLIRNDIRFARIDGTKNTASRDASIQMLTHDPKCTVMLASLAVCSVGLNLVSANQVILADSWWAPAIEDQAVDRVHRLGQKRETTVWKLVMENSIEDHVLEIQKRKRELMSTAFREKMVNKEDRRTTLADIARLLR